MKTIILLLLGISLCLEINRQKQIVDIVNKMNTTWKAKYYGEEMKDIYSSNLKIQEKYFEKKEFDEEIDNKLPREYDLRKKYPNCEALTEIRDQSKCGASWALATAEVMSDRLCIKSNGKIQTRVSAQFLISCCSQCGNGCKGTVGWIEPAFTFWQTRGV